MDRRKVRALWISRHVLAHEPALRAWLRRNNAPGVDLDDVVQESYARLSELESVDGIRNPKAYLYQVAHSIVVSQLRRQRIVPILAVGHLDSFEMPAETPDLETQTHDHQELERLAEAVATLPGKIRNVFILRNIEGLSQRDIALKLGVAESTVEKHIRKGITILASLIGRGGNVQTQSSSDRKPQYRQEHVPDQSRD